MQRNYELWVSEHLNYNTFEGIKLFFMLTESFSLVPTQSFGTVYKEKAEVLTEPLRTAFKHRLE